MIKLVIDQKVAPYYCLILKSYHLSEIKVTTVQRDINPKLNIMIIILEALNMIEVNMKLF